MLRESSQHTGDAVHFDSILGQDVQASPVPFARELVRFADIALSDDQAALDSERQHLRELIGEAALIDVIAVVAMFNAVVIVADACGIALEPVKEEISRDLRDQLKLDKFRDL